MQRNHHAVPTLLAVVAVLLGFNLMRSSADASQEGPTDPPTVVAGAAHQVINSTTSALESRVWRFWSDGSVDWTHVRTGATDPCMQVFQCGPFLVLDGACPADITHDGFVATDDLLEVLGEWGVCPPPGD